MYGNDMFYDIEIWNKKKYIIMKLYDIILDIVRYLNIVNFILDDIDYIDEELVELLKISLFDRLFLLKYSIKFVNKISN